MIQGLDEERGEGLHVDVGALRQQGEGPGHRAFAALLALRAFETLHCELGNAQHRLRVIEQQRIERLLGEAADFRVAQRVHARRARLAGDEGHLAHGFSRHDAPDQARVPVGRTGEGAEAATDYHVKRIRRVTRLEQARASGQ